MIEGIRSSPQQKKPENKEMLRAEEEERLSGMLSNRDREAQAVVIINTLDSFKILTHTDIALKMIEEDQSEYVAEHLSDFEGLDHTDIALKMIEANTCRIDKQGGGMKLCVLLRSMLFAGYVH